MTQIQRKPFLSILSVLGLSLLFLFIGNQHVNAQSNSARQVAIESAHAFTGAKANKKYYKVVYQLNTDDPKVISGALRNISNALKDPRLKGKLKVELVAYSGGWEVFNKDNDYTEKLLELKKKGVILAQCRNTLEERNIDRSQILPFVSIVPSGNGELIIRQAQGWAIVKP